LGIIEKHKRPLEDEGGESELLLPEKVRVEEDRNEHPLGPGGVLATPPETRRNWL